VLGLTVAHQAGYTVQADVINRGIAYLRSQLRTIKSLEQPYLLNRQAFILYVLARAGESDVSRTVALYDQRQNMALYARAFLAHTLYLIDNGDPRISTILSDINNAAILSATGTHWEESVADSYNWNTDTRTTAIVLSVVSQIDPQNPLNANAVRWLMSNRTDGQLGGNPGNRLDADGSHPLDGSQRRTASQLPVCRRPER